jgi:hypothetical protein
MKSCERETASGNKQLHRAHGPFAANQFSGVLSPVEFVRYEQVVTATTVWPYPSVTDGLDAGLVDRNPLSNLSVDSRNADGVE